METTAKRFVQEHINIDAINAWTCPSFFVPVVKRKSLLLPGEKSSKDSAQNIRNGIKVLDRAFSFCVWIAAKDSTMSGDDDTSCVEFNGKEGEQKSDIMWDAVAQGYRVPTMALTTEAKVNQ